MKVVPKNKKNEAWWVDYLEGEVTKSVKADMDMLTWYSQVDAEILKNLKDTKNWIHKNCDEPIPSDSDREYWRGLENRIMAKVKTSPMEVQDKTQDNLLRLVWNSQPLKWIRKNIE